MSMFISVIYLNYPLIVVLDAPKPYNFPMYSHETGILIGIVTEFMELVGECIQVDYALG